MVLNMGMETNRTNALDLARNLLAEADYDVDREADYRGSSYDAAVERRNELAIIVAALEA